MIYYDLRKDELKVKKVVLGENFYSSLNVKKSFVARYIENGKLGVGVSDDGEEALQFAKKSCVGYGWSIEPLSKSNHYNAFKELDEESIGFMQELGKEMGKEVNKKKLRLEWVIERKSYEDCNGVEYTKTISYGVFSVWVAKRKGSRVEQSYDSIYFFDRPKFEDFEKVVKNAIEIANHKLEAFPVKPGKYDVILHPFVGSIFAHEALGHLFEADQKKSVLKDKIGESIAPEWFSLFDNPLLKHFGFYPFDDDGVDSKKTILVENGIVKDYLRDRLNGGGGNGRAQCGKPPIVRMSNTYIGKGDASFDEMLDGFTGYLFLKTSRGSTHPESGEYRFSVDYGFWVENGEIKKKVKGGIMAGKTLELLQKVDLVGKKVEMEPHAGFCGKDGQAVRVSGGAPYLKLRDYVVG